MKFIASSLLFPTLLTALLLSAPVLAQEKSPDSWLVKPPPKLDSSESKDEKESEQASDDSGSPTDQAAAKSPQTVSPTPAPRSLPPAEKPKPAGFDEAVKLYKSGKTKEAIAKFEKFVNTGTADDESREYLAASYQAQKQYAKALVQYDWLKEHARSLTMRRTADHAGHTIRCYQRGICPANCLKLSMPGWQYMSPEGKKSNLRWIKFNYSGGWAAFSEHHLGELVAYDKEGKPVSKGKCPVCHGTGRVPKIK